MFTHSIDEKRGKSLIRTAKKRDIKRTDVDIFTYFTTEKPAKAARFISNASRTHLERISRNGPSEKQIVQPLIPAKAMAQYIGCGRFKT